MKWVVVPIFACGWHIIYSDYTKESGRPFQYTTDLLMAWDYHKDCHSIWIICTVYDLHAQKSQSTSFSVCARRSEFSVALALLWCCVCACAVPDNVLRIPSTGNTFGWLRSNYLMINHLISLLMAVIYLLMEREVRILMMQFNRTAVQLNFNATLHDTRQY